MKKHIIFDFDDTIASLYEFNQQNFVETLLYYCPEIDQEYVRQVHFQSRGTSMDLQFKEIITKFNLKFPIEQLVEKNEQLQQQKSGEIKIFKGLENLLKYFKKSKRIISLTSNRQTKSLVKMLEISKLIKYFENIISCKDEGHEKPDPYCLVKLLGKYPKYKKEEAVFLGDSKTDMEFAQNAKVDFLIIDQYLNGKQFYQVILDLFPEIIAN